MVQKDADQEREMRVEIHEMKKEQSTISMMDEFARHARLERKINKMTDKLKTHGRTPLTSSIVRSHFNDEITKLLLLQELVKWKYG